MNLLALLKVVGVNYDTCHLAVEYEEPAEALGRLVEAGIRISKVHLSSALCLAPEEKALARLRSFEEDTYLHQVVVRASGKELRRFRDLPEAFAFASEHPEEVGEEWRVHFHIPLYAGPAGEFMDTRSHIEGTLAYLAEHPEVCKHLEMETYTWEVLPEEMHAEDVVDQLAREYDYCLEALGKVGIYE